MGPNIERLGWTLVHSVWQFAAVALLAAIVLRGLRGSSARVRYVAATAGFAALLACPVLTWWSLSATPPGSAIDPASVTQSPPLPLDGPEPARPDVPPGAVTPVDRTQPMPGTPLPSAAAAPTLAATGDVTASSPDEAQTGPNPGQHSFWNPMWGRLRRGIDAALPLLVGLWLAGVALLSGRPVAGLWMQWRLQHTGLQPVAVGIQQCVRDFSCRLRLTRSVRVAESALVHVPMVVGYLRPVILLPASVLTGLAPDQLEAVLAHELAHVRRHDWLVNGAQVLAETLFFYHPAVWWLSRVLREERELCCDDLALELIANRAVLARTLLTLEEFRSRAPAPLPIGALAATEGPLLRRVRRLLPGTPADRAPRGWLTGGLLLLGIALAGGGALLSPLTVAGNDAVPVEAAVVEVEVDEADAESSEPQLLMYSFVTNSRLADRLTALGRNDGAKQGAFRQFRFDAAALRTAVFAPDSKASVQGEVEGPHIFRSASGASYPQTVHLHSTFLVDSGRGVRSNGTVVAMGETLLQPDATWTFDLKSVELSVYGPAGGTAARIAAQPLTARSRLPIGEAVAWVAQATGGKEPLSLVLAFESVPRLSDEAARLLADRTWFRAGRVREQETLRQARRFNSRAAKLKEDFPDRWTQPLPGGGSVTLLAIAKPQTHPFCWWDQDGTPRATDWSLQQHALSQVETLALVAVRDPGSVEPAGANPAPRWEGVTYVLPRAQHPVSLGRHWGAAADSAVYLVSLRSVDAGQRPEIRLDVGDGPWTRTADLVPGEERTILASENPALAGMDFLLSPPVFPESTGHFVLARSFSPTVDVRLRLLDDKQKVWPTASGFFSGRVTDDLSAANWSGSEQYDSTIKGKDVRGYFVETRPRHRRTFAGFGTELTAAPAPGALPQLSVAPAIPSPPLSLTEALPRAFDEALRSQAPPVFGEADRRILVDDLRLFLEQTQKEAPALPADRAATLLAGFSGAMPQAGDDYYQFYPGYCRLKWRLQKALTQRELNAQEQAALNRQRESWREIIRTIPTQPHHPWTHGYAIARLERLFENPWHSWLQTPLSAAEEQAFAKERANWNLSGVAHGAANIDTMVERSRAAEEPDATLGTGPSFLGQPTAGLPATIPAETPSLLRYAARFQDFAALTGLRDLVYDEPDRKEARVLDFDGPFQVSRPTLVDGGRMAVRDWARATRQGAIAYDSDAHELYGLQETTLGILPVSSWVEADQLRDADLTRIVDEQHHEKISLEEFFGPRPTTTGYGLPPDGPLLVVKRGTDLAVLRVQSISKNGITGHLRPRTRGLSTTGD